VGSIDGIVSTGQPLGHLRPYQPSRDAETPSLGEYVQREDGFHPMRNSRSPLGERVNSLGQTLEQAEASYLEDEPIVIDEEFDKHKKTKGEGGHPRAKKFFKRAGMALGIFILLLGIYFGYKLYSTERHVLKGGGKAPALAKNIDINQLKGEGDGRINVLALGIGGPVHDGPDLTDTILLASIDPVNHSTALLSIPRDLCIKMPCGPNQKINAVFALAKENSAAKTTDGKIQDGLKALDKTLAPILGVPIHYHAIVDFQAFQQAVDAVGGVDVNVPTTLYDPTIAWENHYNPVIAAKGEQHMDGHKALLYAKSRETSSDFARAMRQRLILVALKQKVLTLGTFSNPVKISNLLNSLGNNVYSDFSLNDITRLYQIGSQVPSSSIASLDMVTPPHDLLITGTVDGATSIVKPKAGLFQYAAIQSYVRNALRDGFIAKENAAVTIYNATSSPGLANKVGDTLKSYGYRVTAVGNAPNATNPATTTLVDISGGVDKYTRH